MCAAGASARGWAPPPERKSKVLSGIPLLIAFKLIGNNYVMRLLGESDRLALGNYYSGGRRRIVRDRRSCGRGHFAASASAAGLLDIVRAGPESASHFDDGVSSLVLEHFLFGPLGPLPLLPADLFDPLLLLALFSEDYGFDLVG